MGRKTKSPWYLQELLACFPFAFLHSRTRLPRNANERRARSDGLCCIAIAMPPTTTVYHKANGKSSSFLIFDKIFFRDLPARPPIMTRETLACVRA